MAYFVNINHTLTFESNSKKYLRLHPPDCCLYSEDGSKFVIHKELLGQTGFLRKILDSTKNCCCVAIQILCPCSEKELGLLVKFLYTGKIICDEVDDLSKTIDNLKEIFGFPNELPLWPEENNDFIIKEEPCDKAENINDDQGENGIDTRSQEPKDDLPVEHLKCSNGKTNPEVISTNDLLDDVTNPEQESIAQAVVDDIENSTQNDDNESSEKPQPKKSLRSSSKKFKCQECTLSFYAKEDLNQHIDGYHRMIKPFLCEYCKKSFTIKENLKRHIKYAHQNLKPHKCIDDDENSEKPQAKKSLRSSSKKFKCDECTASFYGKEGLNQHIDRNHRKIKPFLCDYCKKSFTIKDNLKRHIKYFCVKEDTDGDDRKIKVFICEHCKKSFTLKRNLKRHIEYTHQNLKPYICIECEKAFSLKQGLQRHVIKTHLNDKPSKPDDVEEKKAGVDFKSVEDLDPFSKDDEDQFKALLSEEKSSENMVILINNLSFTSL